MKKIIAIGLMSIFVLSACESDAPDSSKVKSDVKEVVIEKMATTEIQSGSKVEFSAVEKSKSISKEDIKKPEKIALSGQQIYKKSCFGCHGTGAAGAPKLGDKAAWSARLSKGTDALYQSAIKGVPGTAMMAKGSCTSCSDDELRRAVDYLLEHVK